uniref:Tetratricopeptide repeat protein 38 n=2 Tax=Macrostomum lignano TaxID=282301 RepID=A0A1I8HX54_9PLAT
MSCPASFYNLHQWQKECGFALPTTSEATAKLYHATLHQFASLTDEPSLGGLEACLTRLLESEPEFLPGCLLHASLVLPSLEPGSPEFADEMARVTDLVDSKRRAGCLTDWEDSTWLNLQTSLDGDWLALESLLDRHLLKWPGDYVAFQKAFIVALMSGNSLRMRDLGAQVVPHYSNSNLFKPFALSRHGFGLEECYQFQPATDVLDSALRLNPADPWAHHSMAHVFHSTGRYAQGLGYMLGTRETGWLPGNHLSCHNTWHTALFYMNTGRTDRALELYDQFMLDALTASKGAFPASDCVSLLFRLQVAGVDVGKRWQELCDSALTEMTAATAPACKAGATPGHDLLFYDFHLALALACAGRTDQLAEFSDRLVDTIKQRPEWHHSVRLCRGVAVDGGLGEDGAAGLVAATQDFLAGDHSAVCRRLHPLRHRLAGVGGSRAQREIFTCVLAQSACLAKDWPVLGSLLAAAEAEGRQDDAAMARLRREHLRHGETCSE